MECHSLSKSKADRHMEPFIIDITPTDDTDFIHSSHEGEEFIMVMEGSWKSATASTLSYWRKRQNTAIQAERFGVTALQGAGQASFATAF